MSPTDADIPNPTDLGHWQALLGLTLCLTCPAAAAGFHPAPLPPTQEARPVIEVALYLESGARPAFSTQGDRIAFDRAGTDGLYDVYIREVDGPEERCLTCEARELRHRNNLGATWDSSGELVIFLGQAKPKRFGLEQADLLTPLRGLRAELFLFRSDGKNFWQLTRAAESESAILDARFSFEAGRLAWSQRVSTRGGESGRWRLMVGRVETSRGGAQIKGIREYEPPERPSLILAQEFLPDEHGVLISANLETGQPEGGRDLYELELDDGSATRLTHSRSQIDEYGHISPNGTHIVWSSNTGIRPLDVPGELPSHLRRDLWIMERDGSEKRRLTFFNGGGEESLGEAYVGDFDWHRDGDRLVVHVVHPVDGKLVESLWQVTLEESFRRP